VQPEGGGEGELLSHPINGLFRTGCQAHVRFHVINPISNSLKLGSLRHLRVFEGIDLQERYAGVACGVRFGVDMAETLPNQRQARARTLEHRRSEQSCVVR
jgi:hypothetical protein